jgi:hypothetical protein
MRNLNLFVIVASLILAATGIGVWAASRTTNHVNVQDTYGGGSPVGGGIFVAPPVY